MSAYREAWRLAWPLILSNLSVPLLGIIDTAVVGHLPAPHYLGAVAIGALAFNVLYFVFGFLRMGTTGLTAQAYGRGDGEELRAGLGRALLLAVLIAALMLSAGAGMVAAAGAIFEPGPRVAAELETYLRIRLLGAPAGLANMALLGWLLGMQNARGPMALLIATNGVNIVLDLWFVLGLGWGVAGVAAATVAPSTAASGSASGSPRGALRGLPGAWSWRAIAARRRLRPAARGQPRHHAAQPVARGRFPDLHGAELAPGRAGARRQRGAAQFPDLRGLRPGRLRPRRRGHGRPPCRRRQPGRPARRDRRESGPGARPRRCS